MGGFHSGYGLMPYYARKRSEMIRLACTLFFLLLSTSSFAATANWDSSSDASIQGYRLYRAEGTCALHGYFFLTNSYGVVTSGAITDPTTGGTYCHFLTAFNTAGESVPSVLIEFSYTIAEPPQCPSVSYCRTLKGQARKNCLACK